MDNVLLRFKIKVTYLRIHESYHYLEKSNNEATTSDSIKFDRLRKIEHTIIKIDINIDISLR